MKRLVFDIETDGLEATKIWCIVAQDVETRRIYSYGPHQLEQACTLLDSADCLVGHNIIGFDIPFVRSILNKPDFAKGKDILDTLVLSRLFNPTREGGHSLEQWGHTLGFKKIKFDDFSRYTDTMLNYCVRDVELNTETYYALKENSRGFSPLSIKIEHAVAFIMEEQEQHGFYFDRAKAELLLAEIRERKETVTNEVKKAFKPYTYEELLFPYYTKGGLVSKIAKTSTGERRRLTAVEHGTVSGRLFHLPNGEIDHDINSPITRTTLVEPNISSRKQIGEFLIDAGWEPTEFTVHGRPIVNEKTLSAVKGIPEADLLKEYFLLEKRYAQIESWVDTCKESSSGQTRVHGYVIPNGTITGRMAHREPNMAQVPSINSIYGKECRECWTVPKGYKLVGIDASGLELRMLAHYMNDKDYTNEIINGDIHTTNQRLAGLESRDQAKTFIYALLYGAGDGKLGSVAGGGAETGKKLRKSFFDNLTSFATLKDQVARVSTEREYLKGLDGRKLKIRNSWAALNTLLQGAGAILMKQALVILYDKIKELELDAHFVANVHDEWQLEVREDQADEVGRLGVEAIIEAGKVLKLKCPLDGEYKIGDNWSETH
jgi:DNA polymerase I-like protein with 3'-5' exonuclease and polymerase domains